MKKAASFLFGAFIGSVLAGTAVILFSPYSGEEFRVEVSKRTQKLIEEVKEANLQRQEELKAELAKYRQSKPPAEDKITLE